MTVYVDNAFIPARVGRLTSRWCHMTADSTEELVAFARSIGLRAEWIQYPGTWKEHFDLTERRRAAAVEAGAKEVDRYEHVAFLAARRGLA